MSYDLPAGTYRLKNVRTGTYLDLWDGRSDPGTRVQGFQSNGGDNQKWILKWTGVGHEVTLQNVKSRTYIGAPGEIADNVQAVGNNKAVSFILVNAERGHTFEVASNRSKVLSLRGGESANETPVIYYSSNEADDQKWYFERA